MREAETVYSFPILLGRKNTELNLKEWYDRTLAVFGEKIPLGAVRTSQELRKLGFVEAAEALYWKR